MSKVNNNVARNDNSSLISNKNANLATCSSDEDCDDCNGCTVDACSKEKKTCDLVQVEKRLDSTFVDVQIHVNDDDCVDNAGNDATCWRV